MKSKMLFDHVRKCTIAEAEIRRTALRYVARNKELPQKTRMLAQFRLAEMPAKSAESRIVLRCTMTGRARGVIPEYNINRMRFRELALQGMLPGVQKASW